MKETIIDEVMSDIRLAEQKADDIVKEAQQQGKDVVLSAQAEADRHRAESQAALKEQRRQALGEAQLAAREKRNAIMKKGADAARELLENKNSAVEEMADKVVSMLIDSYKDQR